MGSRHTAKIVDPLLSGCKQLQLSLRLPSHISVCFFSKYYLTSYLLALLLSISINKDYANLQRHKIKTICFSSEAGQGWNTGKGLFLPPDSSLSATSVAHHQPTADICSERCV